jgi:hypothetical protein
VDKVLWVATYFGDRRYSEQLAQKAFVPALALSDDRALPSTNVVWIFRLPSNTKPAAALQRV